MTRLSPGEFGAFFEAIHGAEPFPWQKGLAERVCDAGWPAALNVPTGAGKTAAMDVAVFHLAIEADRQAGRSAPVRILFVVDRRLVVDDAFRRARRIADALREPQHEILSRVAKRLAALSERPDRPLTAVRLRGGMPEEPDWARTPAQPTIITSTVDQVGSRLFFRGYGVTDSMKPVHAGLMGTDALLLLDEAHLSQPFIQSVRALRGFQDEGQWSENRCPAPFTVVTLSATQAESDQAALLTQADRRHSELGPRLRCAKKAELVPPVKDPTEAGEVVAATLVEAAWALSAAGSGTAQVTAVVVNRVRRARQVFDALGRRLRAAEVTADVILLTGRSRPLARDALTERFRHRMAAGRRLTDEPPLLVVATQCVEAGADLDFDALVTEAAPLDSLRQRFGRLNRMGRAADAAAMIVADASVVSTRAEPDPVYGTAIAATWQLLNDRASTIGKGKSARSIVDFGVEAAEGWLPTGDDMTACLSAGEQAPILLPAFVERWSYTSPVPAADADVALFLHGPAAGPADVSIVWRADLDPADEAAWSALVHACPPSTLEALAVPMGEARRWLAGRARGEIADVEAGEDEEVTPGPRRALRWRGADDEGTQLVWPSALRPGDTVVVPAQWKGCDEWGWSPQSSRPVADLAQEANRIHRGLDILRLSPLLLEADLLSTDVTAAVASERAARFRSLLTARADASRAELLASLANASLPQSWREWLGGEGPVRVIRDDNGVPLALARRVAPAEEVGEVSTESDRALGDGRAIPLSAHTEGVESFAAQFAGSLGLPLALVDDVRLAARLHDLGKAHPDFKLLLYGGDELAAAAGVFLAKSGRGRLPERVRSRVPLPKGARHEIASLALAQGHPDLGAAHDAELVLWLIGTHHGWGRPFFPAVAWPPAGETIEAAVGAHVFRSVPVPSLDRLTAWWIDLHADLTRRYGPWGLARLEAILRLADHRQSEREGLAS